MNHIPSVIGAAVLFGVCYILAYVPLTGVQMFIGTASGIGQVNEVRWGRVCSRGGGQLRRLLQGVKFCWFEGTGDDFPDAEEIAEGVQRPSDQVRPPTFVPDTTALQNINTLRQAPPALTKWKLQIARANLLG